MSWSSGYVILQFRLLAACLLITHKPQGSASNEIVFKYHKNYKQQFMYVAPSRVTNPTSLLLIHTGNNFTAYHTQESSAPYIKEVLTITCIQFLWTSSDYLISPPPKVTTVVLLYIFIYITCRTWQRKRRIFDKFVAFTVFGLNFVKLACFICFLLNIH